MRGRPLRPSRESCLKFSSSSSILPGVLNLPIIGISPLHKEIKSMQQNCIIYNMGAHHKILSIFSGMFENVHNKILKRKKKKKRKEERNQVPGKLLLNTSILSGK